jgi:hypothetical protein
LHGFRVLSLLGHLWFTASLEITSSAFSGVVGVLHRRIGLHLPLNLSISHGLECRRSKEKWVEETKEEERKQREEGGWWVREKGEEKRKKKEKGKEEGESGVSECVAEK